MKKINEGMRAGDLSDLILPMVSVDEYESKIDDDAVVVGFYVHDRDAASDLNRFLQKSPIQILDTEISPAPDQHGYYLVFVELLNDRRIAKNIKGFLDEVSPLGEIDKWQMRLRGNAEIVPFSEKILSLHFAEMREDNVDDEDKVMEFLKNSALENAIMESDVLTIGGKDGKYRATVVGIGENSSLFETHELSNHPVSLQIEDIAKTIQLQRILGEGWVPSIIGSKIVLQRTDSNMMLLLADGRFL